MTTFTDLQVTITTLSGDITDPTTEDVIDDVSVIESLDITHSVSEIANCKLTIAKSAFVSSFDEQNMIHIAAGLGTTTDLFLGDQDGVGFDGYGRASIPSVGLLGRLEPEWGNGEYVYESQTSAEIARNYIEKSAIPSDLHNVADSDWDPTTPEPIVLRDRDSPLKNLRDLVDQELRFVTERANGAIYIDAIVITGDPVESFDDSTPGVVITRDRTRRELRNKIIVTGRPDALGSPLTSEASTSSLFVLSPQDFWVKDLNFPLIQDQTQADVISARALEIYNVRPEKGSVIAPLAVGGQPGQVISLTSSYCNLSSVKVFVESVTYHVVAGTREIRWWRFPES